MEPIAIIGMAARFPGSADIGEYWSNLQAGRELITLLAAEELLAAGVPPAVVNDPSFVRACARIPGYDEFDAEFFGVTPREATLNDPQMRAFMEVCHSAVEDAGYDPYAVPGAVGVYGGLGYPTYGYDNLRGQRIPANEGLIALLNGADYLATHVSYKFSYTGPSMTILTACSSSLTAVHLACQALQVGDCDLALAGGVNIDAGLIHGYWFVPGGVRSRDGHCRPFDVSAGGTIFGQGAGVVVLKRLVDATADGDSIRAVVLGTGLNNDGSDKVGFGAPSVSGQLGCIQDAMLSARVQPQEIGYVEAHGTGTALGDPIEITALAQAWRELQGSELEPGSCLIGSVKSNIGHAVQAAGVAGLIKLVLALEHGEIPATVNFTAPNPRLELDKTPFAVASRLVPWPAERAGRRVGALSSLGAGGTNAHAVVAAAPTAAPTPAKGRPRLVLFSARSQTAVGQLGQRLAGHFESMADDAFEDSVTTLQRGRRHYEVRRAAIAADWREAVRALGAAELASGGDQAGGLIAGTADKGAPAVAFAFPGQGSLFPGMGLELYACDSVFREAADECLALYGDRAAAISEHWTAGADPRDLADTAIAQPLLFLVEHALAQSWQAAAGPPGWVLGHSLGELVAATVAGVLDLPTAARLVLRRADAMAAMPPGAMAALFCQEEAVAGRLPDQVSLAALNSATETVVAGPRDALETLLAELRADGIRSRMLRTSHGFHSPAMAPAAEAFERELAGATLRAPSLPMISAATGRLLSAQEALDPHFWAAQLVTPVWYARALDCLIDSGARLVLEMGPGEALTALARGRAPFDDAARVAMPVLPRPRKDEDDQERRAMLRALGTAWTHGLPVAWAAVDKDWPAVRRSVPGYPYQRQRYWVDDEDAHSAARGKAEPVTAGQPPAEPEPAAPATRPGAAIAASPFATLTWLEQQRPPAEPQQRADLPAVVLLPPQEELALRVVLALQQAGLRVYPVRTDGDLAADDGDLHVRPGHPQDLRTVFSQLTEIGVAASCLVHATSLPDWDQPTAATVTAQLDGAYFGLLGLVQQAARASAGSPAAVLVLTSRSVDIAGGEHVDPAKATLHGQLRTMLLEEPRMDGLLIDIGPGVPEEDLVDEVRAFAAGLRLPGQNGEPVVGLRGSRRWVRRELPLTLVPQALPPLRRKGTYLITGGLGGLGLAVARGLARTGLQPALVLLGRTGLPEGEDVAASLATGDARARRLHDAIREITRQGCAVRVIAADVADARAMRRALDVAAAHLGPINGVLHLAGIAGDGMQLLRSPERASQVLSPKVAGTLQLHELLAERGPLDFFVTFSSRASMNGLIGSGDYAAANAFADALSGTGGLLPGTRQLSINWPAWAQVGMAAAAGQLRDPAGTELSWETTLDATGTWALDEHRLDAMPVLPGTAHLDLVVKAFRELVAAPATAVRIEAAVFHRPLVVPASCVLRVAFSRDGAGWRFRTESLGEAGPLTHASGRIEEVAAGPRQVDLEALRARFAGAQALSTPSRDGRTFRLGPRWDALTEVLQAGQEKLVAIRLPERFAGDLATHPLHPTVLDCATASARGPSDGPYLPFMYRSLVLHGDLPEAVTSYLRRATAGADSIMADIDIIAPDGTVAAEIEGFTMRRFDPAAILREPSAGTAASTALDGSSAPGTTADGSIAVDAMPAGLGSGQASAEGIDPDVGVQLLLDLLAARTPAQVAVRPFEHGKPMPLDAPMSLAAPTAPARAGTAAAAGTGTAQAGSAQAGSAQAGAAQAAAVTGAGRPSTDEVRAAMREIWELTIGTAGFAADDNFFDVGGSSLSAIELMTRIRDRFGVELSIAMLLDSPTIESLAGELSRQLGD